jgi:hypothetical protein
VSRPLLSSHSTPAKAYCEAVACGRRTTVVSVHIVTPTNGDGRQAIVIGQMCDLHAAELQEELRAVSEVRAPLYVMRGAHDG